MAQIIFTTATTRGQALTGINSMFTEVYSTLGQLIGGSVGVEDNTIPRANGAGGMTLQGSLVTIDDAGNVTANDVFITTGDVNNSLSNVASTADGAAQSASTAQTAANNAQTAADTAQGTATDAANTANTANTNAGTALTSAAEAQDTSNTAQTGVGVINSNLSDLFNGITPVQANNTLAMVFPLQSGGGAPGVVTYTDGFLSKMNPDPGWVVPASTGDKTIQLTDYAEPDDFTGSDTTDVTKLSQLGDQVALLTVLLQALLTTLQSNRFPTVA